MALLERDVAIREESRWLMKGGFERCTGTKVGSARKCWTGEGCFLSESTPLTSGTVQTTMQLIPTPRTPNPLSRSHPAQDFELHCIGEKVESCRTAAGSMADTHFPIRSPECVSPSMFTVLPLLQLQTRSRPGSLKIRPVCLSIITVSWPVSTCRPILLTPFFGS
jgi:hypothetical protein